MAPTLTRSTFAIAKEPDKGNGRTSRCTVFGSMPAHWSAFSTMSSHLRLIKIVDGVLLLTPTLTCISKLLAFLRLAYHALPSIRASENETERITPRT